MEEIINKIFKEKYPNGLSAEYTKEEIIGYMMAINDIKEQLQLYIVNYRRELLKFLGDEINESLDDGDRIYDGNLFIEDVAKNFNCG
jgi:hypothetical protein